MKALKITPNAVAQKTSPAPLALIIVGNNSIQ